MAGSRTCNLNLFDNMPKRLIIIGAGPIGIEAGLAARQCGYVVTVLESGAIADAVQRWGHVRMFSPFSMNASELGQALLRQIGRAVPEPEALLTGAEYADQYLIPMGQALGVKMGHRVKAITRDGDSKSDHILQAERAEASFRLLVESPEGEQHAFADLVFDCTGVFSLPNPLGDGGIPALGEASLRDVIRYGLGEVADLEASAGKRSLVVGGGHSASTLVVRLSASEGAQVTWVNKKTGEVPCPRLKDDPLTERDRLSEVANQRVACGKVTYLGGRTVHALKREAQGVRVILRLEGGRSEEVVVDQIIAATGYRPDLSLARELQVQTCWATEGTYPLAASLLGESGGDCLAVPAFGVDTLKHPEPGYFALGMKSYGRTPDFLIQTGRAQVESLLQSLT